MENGVYLHSLAYYLARVKHADQVRKVTGEPYFNHLTRVSNRVEGGHAKIVGLLHDILEDTNMTAADLRRVGFGWDVVDDVVALSREACESYFDFIARTIKDATDEGLQVKLADLEDNLKDPPGDLRARYIKADIMIRAALRDRGVLGAWTARMPQDVQDYLSQVS
jgi:hypothetical protein